MAPFITQLLYLLSYSTSSLSYVSYVVAFSKHGLRIVFLKHFIKVTHPAQACWAVKYTIASKAEICSKMRLFPLKT